jgi:hypothetical protein
MVEFEEKIIFRHFINFQYFGVRVFAKNQHKNEILILPSKNTKSKI